MNDPYLNFTEGDATIYNRKRTKSKNRYWLHILLFAATFFSCLIAGAHWAMKDPTEISNWHYGFLYAILTITFLTAHEFGHYFASVYHKVDATLPFYIPSPIPDALFGTFGAVIKTRSPMTSKKALFDIGVSGPIAGFIVSIVFLIIGFETLPQKEFIYTIHPQYMLNGGFIPDTGLHFGDNIILTFFEKIFQRPGVWIPPMNEIYHFPFLCVGWFGLFVTSLNLLPIGQLDGGHVIYTMFGIVQSRISRIFWYMIIFIGIGSLLNLLCEFLLLDLPNTLFMSLQKHLLPFLAWLKGQIPWYFGSWSGWLFWAVVTRIFIKLDHPDIVDLDEDLGTGRKMLGWFAIIILIISFSYNGLYFK